MSASIHHRSFVITRELPGTPAHAFRFWSEHDLKRRWTACHPDWHVIEDRFDFRVDGQEVLAWRTPDGIEQTMLAHFLEVYPRQRIVYAYVMRADGAPISSSLVTVEFEGRAGKTLMTFTEQAVFSSTAHGEVRETGTGIGFSRLAEVMADIEDPSSPGDRSAQAS